MAASDLAKHPAKWSDRILDVISGKLEGVESILDPFGGVGKIGNLKQYGFRGRIVSNELEPEWADQGYANGCDEVIAGDALLLGEKFPGAFDAVVTSPVYGNRMSDHHEAKDTPCGGKKTRMTYRHKLGRALSRGNSGMLQWGPKYKAFHLRAWPRIIRAVRPNGVFILNCSNHIRKGVIQPVTQWHTMILQSSGLELLEDIRVETMRMRFGQNHGARVDHESVVIFRVPGK